MANHFSDIWNLIDLGGPIMWPLLLCSTIGFAVIIEKFWAISNCRLNFDRFLKELKQCPTREKALALLEKFSNSSNPLVRLARVYLNYLSKSENRRNEALKREGYRLLAEQDQHLRILATIAHISPLLGLLGTVLGLVTTFQSIGASGNITQPAQLASGIWAALLTTVFGLAVGIPCMVAHNYFYCRNDKIARQMKELVSELDEIFEQAYGSTKIEPDFSCNLTSKELYEETT